MVSDIVLKFFDKFSFLYLKSFLLSKEIWKRPAIKIYKLVAAHINGSHSGSEKQTALEFIQSDQFTNRLEI